MSDRSIVAARDGLRAIRRYMKPNVTMRQIAVFLDIALFGPITAQELAVKVQAKPGTLYDDLQDLGRVAANGKAGKRLIEELKPAAEGEAYQYRITARGEMALQALALQIEGSMLPDDADEDAIYLAAKSITRG